MTSFAVTYEYDTTDPEAMAEKRPKHKGFLSDLHDKGILKVSGPVDGGSGALIVLEAGSSDEVARLLDDDPFQVEGFIRRRRISEWTVVFGSLGS